VVAISEGAVLELLLVERFAEVVALLEDGVESIAVDMPIGLPERGARACDVEARRQLGPRRSSVFPAPPRTLLHERDYGVALRTKRAIDGVGLSKQAFNLLPKIAEVDAAMTPVRQAAVVECHPELAFARLAGGPLEWSKRAPEGALVRRELVEEVFGSLPSGIPHGAAGDDVLDAVALVVAARRLATGTAERLGDRTRDSRGLVMEIAY
jgi:predicted RNase H-like nuclease